MKIEVGLEIYPGYRTQAWVLDHFGCFAYGKESGDALKNVPQALRDYQAWVAGKTKGSWLHGLEKREVNLAGTWEAYTIDKNFDIAKVGYEVESFFRHDWKPLTEEQITRLQMILQWSRADLLAGVKPLKDAQLDHTFTGERWSIRGVLRHVAIAEQWYLSRLDLADGQTWRDLPKDVFEALDIVRKLFIKKLPEMMGMEKVVGAEGEMWSPRKIARRAAWHERDHVEHIGKLIKLLSGVVR